MKRVFLYARVSTEEQAIHGLSIEAQMLALEEWAKGNGHKIVDTYVDAGISARKPASKRPELQRLLADARAGKGDLIVFTKLDRWFRNIAEYYKVQEILEQCHVDWRTIHEDYDTSTASGRLKINIMLSVAQDEADRTSERIKAIFVTKREKLEAVTGCCPVGYKIEGKRFVKDPETQDAVEAFFKTFLATGSISAARQCALEKHGLALQYQRAHKMLDNPAYCGRYFCADGMTPPYISQEEFERIASMRRRVVRKSPKNRIYLFSGLVYCGECGHRMGCRANTKQNYKFYNCSAHYLDGTHCGNKTNISERKVEAFILESLNEKIRFYQVEADRRLALPQKSYKQEISALRAKIARLKELYLNDLMSLEEYRVDYNALRNRLNDLIEKDKPAKMPNLKALEPLLQDGWEKIYEGSDDETKREFWRVLVREIRIYPDRHIEFDLNV